MRMEIDLEAILQTFLVKSEEQLSLAEEALVTLETRPEDQETVELIFRVFHTLKGDASSLGFSQVAEFVHVAEDILQRLRRRTLCVTSNLITLLLKTVDALHEMVPDAVAGFEEIQPAHAELMKGLGAIRTTATEEAAAVGVEPSEGQERPKERSRKKIQALTNRGRTLRVDIEKLDRMVNLSGEITVAQGRLRQVLETRVQKGEEALEAQGQVDRLCMELQEQIMKVRMIPIGPIFRQYIRTVRDLAQANGKVARVAIEGEDVEVDMSVVEHLKDPLTHMVRNALDHGIEPPDVRKASGKDPCGCITLRTWHDAGSIVIQVADDGAGLNRQRILERALSRGMISESQILSQEETYRLVFEPGFSTAQAVTELSGRGVGMDVVRRNIEALRGSVAIESREGEGTTINIRLPLTLAIIEGLRVGVGEETYIIPLDAVIECLDLPEEERHRANGHGVINLRGKPLPYLRLRDHFSLAGAAPPRENVVVVKHEGAQVGITVDALHGESQAVIKPLGKLFHGLPGVAGSTILGNGRVVLILDVPTLLQEMVGGEAQALGNA